MASGPGKFSWEVGNYAPHEYNYLFLSRLKHLCLPLGAYFAHPIMTFLNDSTQPVIKGVKLLNKLDHCKGQISEVGRTLLENHKQNKYSVFFKCLSQHD